jgi:hypothetical protein
MICGPLFSYLFFFGNSVFDVSLSKCTPNPLLHLHSLASGGTGKPPVSKCCIPLTQHTVTSTNRPSIYHTVSFQRRRCGCRARCDWKRCFGRGNKESSSVAHRNLSDNHRVNVVASIAFSLSGYERHSTHAFDSCDRQAISAPGDFTNSTHTHTHTHSHTCGTRTILALSELVTRVCKNDNITHPHPLFPRAHTHTHTHTSLGSVVTGVSQGVWCVCALHAVFFPCVSFFSLPQNDQFQCLDS